MTLEASAKRAIANIYRMGESDVFPRSFESMVLNDHQDDVVKLIKTASNDVKAALDASGPYHTEMLAPAGSLGFRRVASLDPFWDAVLLSFVIEIGPKLEAARTPIAEQRVFSYRFLDNQDSHKLFADDFGWRAFLTHASEKSKNYPFVLTTDISDFYARLNHHRLQNALAQAAPENHYVSAIMDILNNYSDSNSYGLPVGGNAARILAEATFTQIDSLLTIRKFDYCRFVDDMVVFCISVEDAYQKLATISSLLADNQGLLLQRTKTRILTSAEFQSSVKLSLDEEADGPEEIGPHRRRLASLRLKYDPYSPTAEEDYTTLQKEIESIDLLMLLEHELSKSTVHIHSARRIVSAMRYSNPLLKQKTLETLIQDLPRLYPISALVFDVIRSILINIDAELRAPIRTALINLHTSESFVLGVEYHLLHFVRALTLCPGSDTLVVLEQIYSDVTSPLVRREVILSMHALESWYWLSNLRTKFVSLSPPERRAFIVTSFSLKDEGSHWRKRVKASLTPFEKLIMTWASNRENVARV